MTQTFQKTIDRLPAILVHNAPSMIRRMVASMRAHIAERGHQANAAHGILFLRVGEADLEREFGVAMAQAVEVVREKIEHHRGSPPSLALETESDLQALESKEFKAADAAFSRLCGQAQAAQVIGCEAWHKDVFIKALKRAFENSRMDGQAMAELMPYARRALDAELVKLYVKLESVGLGSATAAS